MVTSIAQIEWALNVFVEAIRMQNAVVATHNLYSNIK
jgi:hypothetical protein